ncbi:HMG domain-containing 3 isoform X2 [Labeo rohita]|uniref:HMG domain-containing 3 isoform X2 n=1 Tax=Labeo rohita TaxID=84645 RepID=A0A498LEM8_LABRO|nr:HMG domain-containing 3 isoform X2 [Labeo rohita]
MPKETSCVECAGELTEPLLITADAKLVTYTGVVNGFSTYCKACPDCGLMYRYQEWSDGIHNFNDHILITLHLCIVLRESLQTHHSVSRAIEVLEQTENKTFPKKATILHAYMHFEAMTSHSYMYSCYKCGYYPPVVVMDLHRKGVFNMPVSEMEAPPAHFDGTVDIKLFWDSVMSEIVCSGLLPLSEMEAPPAHFDGVVDSKLFWDSVMSEIVCSGFLPCGRKNPFVVVPCYNNWAPWIGPKTRRDDIVFNTEHEKFHAPRQATEMADLQMTEERLQDALINLKVDMVRKLCKQCGLDSKGSKIDLILRLRDEMKNRSSYDKIFEKAQLHRYQLKQRKEYNLLAYVLDRAKDPNEDLLQLSPAQTLKRSDFWSLAFDELEATIANQCFQLIAALAASQGKDVFVNSYVVVTWLPLYNSDPRPALPVKNWQVTFHPAIGTCLYWQILRNTEIVSDWRNIFILMI